ncbi:hypothetical protein [Neobacillus drentensis]|jgi:hypothetical protein|uniref:hypothetical protein n=1 Tax=Neobacillus drentensis TaxID=220684 RepID=UPI000BF59FD8|nr:hypothetical protein CN481_16240 [Bacillus sp. AFS006103]
MAINLKVLNKKYMVLFGIAMSLLMVAIGAKAGTVTSQATLTINNYNEGGWISVYDGEATMNAYNGDDKDTMYAKVKHSRALLIDDIVYSQTVRPGYSVGGAVPLESGQYRAVATGDYLITNGYVKISDYHY